MRRVAHGSDTTASRVPSIKLWRYGECESNFPVDKLSCSYGNLWNAFKRIANELGHSVEECVDLFHRTAARCYSLEVTVGSSA